ncbi:(+)-neomenthol dehydrogenase [Linum perenne]
MASTEKKRYAIVTGGNKGIGFEICKQLASSDKGIVVILTARDVNRGIEAVQKIRHSRLLLSSDDILFHQLDVSDAASICCLADFVKSQFGKLDILVNNAGVIGVKVDYDALQASGYGKDDDVQVQVNWEEIIDENNVEAAEDCLEINYNGVRRMVETFMPLLQLSDSPTIVNLSSSTAQLKVSQNLENEWAKGKLREGTEKEVDEVLSELVKDIKQGSLIESKGWPIHMAAYIVSKAAVNAYTRITARKYPKVWINSVCPGYVKTELNFNMGILTTQDGAASPVRLALFPISGGGTSGSASSPPSGHFFIRMEEAEF